MSRRHRFTTYAGLALAATLALSGCDGQSNDDAGNGSTDTTASTPPASTPTTTGETTEPGGTTDTSPTTSAPTTRDDSSIARARRSRVPLKRMPGFNDQWTWDGVQSWNYPAPEGLAGSRCRRASLTAIGGVAEYDTVYSNTAAPDDVAGLTTAVFPDEHTAVMAESVLAKWLATCRSNVQGEPGVKRVKVTADTTVDTVVGLGHLRLVSHGPVAGHPDDGYFNGEGYVRDGDVLSYVVFHSVGQDYNYPAGEQPADQALRVAATYLKRSR